MGLHLKTNGDQHEPLSDINVTPFVDVLLVLLIIFMITAPVITQTIRVKLPEESLRSSDIVTNRKFVVTLDRKGRYYLNNQRIKIKNLTLKAVDWYEKRPTQPVFIRADERVPYGQVTKLMSLLKNTGITNVGLLVEKKS